jgi:hypothetical protein
MRSWKPLIPPTITLAVLIALLAAGGQLVNAQSPMPTTRPTVPTTAPTATTVTSEDIRDIRPPIHIPYGWLRAVYVAGGLGLVGLAFAAWRWHRRHGALRPKLLYELTLEQLEAARAFMKPEMAYSFSIAVSEIIRNYIEQRFHARAAHRTTEEFLHDLFTEQHAALTTYQPLLADFLEHCDLAKFARWQLSVPQMEAMHQSACTFVIETGKAIEPVVDVSITAEPEPIIVERRSV